MLEIMASLCGELLIEFEGETAPVASPPAAVSSAPIGGATPSIMAAISRRVS